MFAIRLSSERVGGEERVMVNCRHNFDRPTKQTVSMDWTHFNCRKYDRYMELGMMA